MVVDSISSVGDRSGRYEIIEHLARTDMAELLLARVTGPEDVIRHVAIKRLRSEHATDRAVVDMFLSEARLAATLHHEHIVQVTDIGEHDGVPYFAMEYVHGEDLRRLLARVHERSEQVPVPHVIALALAAATGLHAAHEQKGSDGKSLEIVHRDVSPANILLGYDGNVKVVDFGIARATFRTAQTQTQMLRGKAPYMSPEQCSGKKLDRRSDVFSLGIVLYELATCRRLFKASNEYLTMAAIVACQIPPPSSRRADLPKPLEEVILRALSREPAARYQTAQQLLEALDAVALELGLRSTTSALAAYAKQLFGERPEPWTAPSAPRPSVHVDFDGKGTGLAPPPSEALQAKVAPSAFKTKVSPIEAARAQALATAPTTSALPVVIPEGAPRKDPTAPVVFPDERAKRVTRAPVPPPTRQRPKTIQIPSGGSPRGDVTLAGIGIIRPPAAVGDVTIAGAGVASEASGIGMIVPHTSGFEATGATTEIVAAMAVQTTVEAPSPVPTANASTVAAASAVNAARKRSRSSGTIKVADATDAVPAPPKGRGRSRSSGLSKAVVTEPIRVTETTAAVEPPVEPPVEPLAVEPSEVIEPPRTEPARAAPRLSVMAFAARPRELSTLTPIVVPPSTTSLSAPIPVVPVAAVDDNWDSSSFPAPPSATAFVPMGAGDAVRIGRPPAGDDDPDSSSVLTPSFVGAVELIDAPDRNSTEIVAPLPPPRPSAPPGDAWANGDDDLDGWPPQRRWWPFAVAAGAAVLLVIVLAVALSGGKSAKSPTAEEQNVAPIPAAKAPPLDPSAAAAAQPVTLQPPGGATTANPPETATTATTAQPPNGATTSLPNSNPPGTTSTVPPGGTANVATTVQPPSGATTSLPNSNLPGSTPKVATSAKQPTGSSKLAVTPQPTTTSKLATTKQPTSSTKLGTTKQSTSRSTVATTKQPTTTSKVATTARPPTTTSKVATSSKQPTTSKVVTTKKQSTTTSKVVTTKKQSTTAKQPTSTSKVTPTAKQPTSPPKAATTKSAPKPPATSTAPATKKPAVSSMAKTPVPVGKPAVKPKK